MTARALGSACGERLPRNSGSTWVLRASSAVSPTVWKRATARRSRKSSRLDVRGFRGRREPRDRPDASARDGRSPAPAADWPPSLSHRPGNHRREIRAPDARHEARRLGRRHDAGRSAHDIGEAIEHIDRRAVRALPADRADPAGMGVDQRRRRPACPAADRALRPPPACRPSPSAVPGSAISLPIFCASRRPTRSAEADPLEVVPAPAPLVGEIGPFAGQRAHRARRAAGRAQGEDSRQDRRNARPRRYVAGKCSFSHSSFGVSISGEMMPPT